VRGGGELLFKSVFSSRYMHWLTVCTQRYIIVGKREAEALRPQATSVCGLKLPVYEALSYTLSLREATNHMPT